MRMNAPALLALSLALAVAPRAHAEPLLPLTSSRPLLPLASPRGAPVPGPVRSAVVGTSAIATSATTAHAAAAQARPSARPFTSLASSGQPLPGLAASGRPMMAPPTRLLPMASLRGMSPGMQCRQAIRAAETAAGIPSQLMAAIGRVESGRREADGSVNPWPWSFNAEGEDHVFDTKAQAIAAVQALQAHGMRSIDIGCMQVNLMYHPDAFANLDEAFDPVANAKYAARFLLQLKDQTGAWPTATAWYHSATPELGEDYRRKVMAVWPEEQKHHEEPPRLELAAAWAATRPGGTFLPSGGVAPNVGRVLPGRGDAGRLAPMQVGASGGGNAGPRGLAAYRSMPIPLAARLQLVPALPAAAKAANNRG